MKIKDYSGKYNEITRLLLESFSKVKKGKNIVLSPLSILMLLGIAAKPMVATDINLFDVQEKCKAGDRRALICSPLECP